jgi:hypothetical protein
VAIVVAHLATWSELSSSLIFGRSGLLLKGCEALVQCGASSGFGSWPHDLRAWDLAERCIELGTRRVDQIKQKPISDPGSLRFRFGRELCP